MIVVDCAPTGDTLRLLALPETIGFYAQRLMGAPQRVLRSIAASLTGLPGTVPNAAVRDAMGELLAELMAARELLADPDITGVRLVLTPERVVVAEARRLYTALTLHGFGVEAAIVNRVIPQNAGGEFLRRHREAQREALTQVRGVVRRAGDPHRSDGAVRTRSGSTCSPRWRRRCSARPTRWNGRPARPRSPSRAGDGQYRLTLPLPLVDRGELALSRSGDDLVVTVGDVRRRIALPAVLKRCSTTGARFESGCLVVDFVAGPAALAGRPAAWWTPDDRRATGHRHAGDRGRAAARRGRRPPHHAAAGGHGPADGEAAHATPPAARSAAPVPGAACTACPLCRFLALIRGERPEAAARFVDGALLVVRGPALDAARAGRPGRRRFVRAGTCCGAGDVGRRTGLGHPDRPAPRAPRPGGFERIDIR